MALQNMTRSQTIMPPRWQRQSLPKKKPKKDDEPGLARPWDTDDSDENATRAQKRGGKIGKRGDGGGPAPQPSGGMSAGVKLN